MVTLAASFLIRSTHFQGFFHDFSRNFFFSKTGRFLSVFPHCAMSVIQGRDLKITNIRGGRPKPGLARQHACGVEAACKLRNGITHKGVEIGSQSLEINCNNLIAMTAVRENVVEHIDIKSAGSISLVLQTIVPILVECENSLVQIKGGTRVDFAPWVDYFNMVFLKMSKLDKIFKLETIKQGFNPVGGGLIKLHRKSVYFDISSLSYSYLDAGKPDKLELYCFGSGSLSNSCDQIVGLVNLKLQNYGLTVPKESVFQKQYNDKCNVLGCLLIVKTSTGMVKACSKLGNMNKNRKFNYGFFVDDLILKFVRKCVQSEACCDDNMTDQLLVFMAMGGEQSVIRVNYPLSLHAETAIVLIQKFLPERKFKVLPDERGAGEQPTARVFCMDVDKEHLVDYDN